MPLTKRLLQLTRIALALVFLLTGISKLADQASFAEAIGNFGLLPDALVPAGALIIALLEVLGGLLLLGGKPLGLWLVTGLMLLFMGVLLYGIQLGLDVDCGCLGLLDGKQPATLGSAFLRDIPLLLACIVLILKRRKDRAKGA